LYHGSDVIDLTAEQFAELASVADNNAEVKALTKRRRKLSPSPRSGRKITTTSDDYFLRGNHPFF
jgi:hypothetical protein